MTRDIVLVLDNTESYFQHPSFEEVRGVSALSENEVNGETIRIIQITELSFNRVAQFSIESVPNKWLGNEVDRRQEVSAYFDSIEHALAEADTGKREREASTIYQTLASELNRLSATTSDTRLLIVNSDLMELSLLANFYDKRTFSELIDQPDSMLKRLENAYPLGDLTGIEVQLIYTAQSRQDSERFSVLSTFYRKLLEGHGAEVKVGANLIIE
jgi:hypothetical protein